jgi:iron complex outermembrane recepter protein
MALCFAGAASAQTPADTPQATTPPASEAPAAQTPQTSPQAPETTPTAPSTAPQVTVPQVTVEAPRRRPARRAAPAAPARTTTAAPSRPAPTTTPTAPTTTAQPAAPAASPFQPTPSLNAITSNQIQATQAQSFGDLFFTKPGATSAGLAPGASRPVLRGLSDFRVRVQENGIGSMDLSDYGQDHGVPIDPLSVQKIEIYRGPEALRYGSQAVGGVVEATNNRIPFAAPLGGWQTQFLGATTTVDRGLEGGALFDAGTRDFAIHADFYGRRASDYFVPSYPYLFPPDPSPPFNGKQPNSGLHSEGQAVGGSYLFDGGYVGVALSRFTSVYRIPTLEGAEIGSRIDLEQTKITSKGEFRPQSSAIDTIRFWLGAVEYQHDEIGIDDEGIDGVLAKFKNHAQEAKTEIKLMPLATPFGALISAIGTQFDHQQIDTSGEAGGLLGSARTNRGAAYFFNELWLTDTLRTLLAGRIETVRLDGTSGIFPPALVPPPDDPLLALQSLGFTPKSISFSMVQDLPSWLVASATVSRIERAPTALELFAHGAHEASGTFDIGDPTLKIETANTAELGLKRIDGAFRFDGKVFYTKYDNFIFQQGTGILCGESFSTCGVDTEFIQTIYSQRDAIFRGGEVAWQWDVAPVAMGIFGVDGQYDFVRATFTDGSNVPRMPPMRLGGGAYWRNDNWFVRMGLLHAFGQSDLGLNDTPTAGYNLLRMEVSNRQYWQYSPWGPTEIITGLTGSNLLDVDVRNSVQFHKDEILLPGRSIKFFMNAKFGGAPPPSKAPVGYYNSSVGFGAPPIFKAPVATTWSWAGFYLGGNVGYGWGKSDTDTVIGDAIAGTPLVATSTSGKLTGMTYGAQAGFNWQSGAWVAGIEADIQNSRQPGRVTTLDCAGATCNPGLGALGLDAPVGARMEQRLEWFSTLRGRLGVTPTPNSLVYATGGLAVGRIKTSGTVSGSSLGLTEEITEGVVVEIDEDGNPIEVPVELPIVTASADPAGSTFFSQQTKLGWTVGAGAEVRLGGNWTGKVEYLYLDFGTVSTVASLPQNATPIAVNFNSRVTENLVRLGVNYKFDPLGAYGPPAGVAGPLVFKAPIRSTWSWGGFYLGGNIGYGWGKSDTDTAFTDLATTGQLFATASSNRLDGAVGGAQAGYNWVAGNLLAGLEADLNYSGQRAGLTAACPGEVCNPALVGVVGDPSVQAIFEQGQKLEWFATLRGRLGAIVTTGAVAYVTGGLAVGEVMTAGTVFGFDGDGNPVNTIVSSHNTKAGWTAGGGLEAQLIGNWTGRIEYLYLDLGSVTTVPTPAPGSTVAAAFNSRVTDNVVRLGVNYKLDPNHIWSY